MYSINFSKTGSPEVLKYEKLTLSEPKDDEVLMPTLNYIASANATRYIGAIPHFVDSETTNLGVDVEKLTNYLKTNSKLVNGECININTGRRISSMPR